MLRIFVFISVSFVISACSNEQLALKEFKKSNEVAEITKCLGANGNIAWSIFKTDRTSNPDVRVIEAKMSKGDEKFTMQWYYNINTNIAEFAYAGKNGEQTSRIRALLDFSSFCMSGGIESKNKDQAKPNNGASRADSILESEGSDSIKKAPTTSSSQEFVELAPSNKANRTEEDAAMTRQNCSRPVYPATSMRLGEQGATTLRFTVSSTGELTHVDVSESSGSQRLDSAAIAALRTCTFKPKIAGGAAQEATDTLQFTWKME